MKRAAVRAAAAAASLLSFFGGSACERAPEAESRSETAPAASAPSQSPAKTETGSAEPEQTKAREGAEPAPPSQPPEPTAAGRAQSETARPLEAPRAPRQITPEKRAVSGKKGELSPKDGVGAQDTLDRDLARAEAALVDAWRELERAEEELEASGSDCGRACKALGSMQRAAARICALEPATVKGSRCPRAQQKLAKAREQVDTSCGVCPD